MEIPTLPPSLPPSLPPLILSQSTHILQTDSAFHPNLFKQPIPQIANSDLPLLSQRLSLPLFMAMNSKVKFPQTAHPPFPVGFTAH